jgi:hypothetical protein
MGFDLRSTKNCELAYAGVFAEFQLALLCGITIKFQLIDLDFGSRITYQEIRIRIRDM